MRMNYVVSILSLLIGIQSRAQIQVPNVDQVSQPSYDQNISDDQILGPHPGPRPHHGSGWHPGGPRPGWRNGWRWGGEHHPFWWHEGLLFPGFVWAIEAPRFWWQCTAFDIYKNPYSASAPSRDEAAYDALYDCGGPDYQNQCYIPPEYCQLRP